MNISAQETVGEFLDQHGYSRLFRDHYLWPMCAAIWSAPSASIHAFPLRWFLQFFANHGMFSGRDAPAWRTINGGAQRYVQRLTASLSEPVRTHTPVDQVIRNDDHTVTVSTTDGEHDGYDRVGGMSRPQARAMIYAPCCRAVGSGRVFYRPNRAVIHTDASILPPQRAWACWNYHAGHTDPHQPVAQTQPITLALTARYQSPIT